jgi:2-keto-4-pentenoate hydratase
MDSQTRFVSEAASALLEARRNRQPIPPVSDTFGIRDVEEAYAVAELNTRTQVEGGRRRVGKKIGLTSKAVQAQLGVDQPDFGVLFRDMEFMSGESIAMDRLMQPKVEAEVAFLVGKDLDTPDPSWGEFIGGISYALPAIEVVDSAIADWKIGIGDTIADNASCGLYVLGEQPVEIGNIALGSLGMSMEKNGAVCSVGSGTACFGHPLRAAYWLASTMVARGDPLRAGEIVLSGALGPMFPVTKGDLVSADFGSLGNCSIRFE